MAAWFTSVGNVHQKKTKLDAGIHQLADSEGHGKVHNTSGPKTRKRREGRHQPIDKGVVIEIFTFKGKLVVIHSTFWLILGLRKL